ncbi:MAG: adenosylcobinamide-phosphate synthase CbiB [Eubacteriales bacterium]|nr:adenosylcobinamide-phosphate synthase CbiB [Eubacteriales bacterium]
MKEYAAAACIGFILDFIIGDPEGWWHPVRGIGWLIGRLEPVLRRWFPGTREGELAAGGVLVLLVTGITTGAAAALILAAGLLHPWVRFGLMSVMCGQILAARSLKTESMKVYRVLKTGDLEAARRAVSMIVGRDTKALTAAGVTKAAVETVAENASDGVVAPLVWMLIAGPAGGFFYKAVNTMDSMVGYRNEQYLYFGRAAARLDDLVNWLPARITGLLFVAAAWLLPGFDGQGAWRIWRRDHRCHKSPNSAHGEAACAGALKVQLAGDAYYFGVLHRKPTIGDDIRPVEPEDIVRANRLMYLASVMALAAGSLLICVIGH